MAESEKLVLDAGAIARILRRISSEIAERTRGAESLALVGIRKGGVPISRRISEEIMRTEGRTVPTGTVDITLYRDDAATALPQLEIGPSEIPFDVKGRDVVLVDDVLHTGRTVRAAIDCLLDYGRPRRVWLAVICDRGGRELPVAPDFVGLTTEVPEDQMLDVIMDEVGNERAVVRKAAGKARKAVGEG